MKNKVNKYDIFAVCIIVLTLMHIVNLDTLTTNSDFIFLSNRAHQMLSCLQDGNLPFFYYNDFNGVGYGSAFFYGHLTLYPFLPLLYLGTDVFLKFYILFVLTLTYLGVCSLSKRFTEDYKLIGVLYMSSVFSIMTFVSYGMYSNFFGVALGFFFIARCIDFFRDKKSFIPSSILFFLILNTHMITAVLCFIFSIIICVLYFNKTQLRNYFKFAGVTVILCLYNIVNMLYHLSSLSLSNSNSFKDVISDGAYMFYSSSVPYGGLSFSVIFNKISNNGFKQLNFLILGVCLVLLIKRRKSLTSKEKFALLSYLVLTIISIQQIWFLLFSNINNPIQFSMRYIPYILVVFLIICFRDTKSRLLISICLLSCLPELVLASIFTSPASSNVYDSFQNQVMNGEYLDSSFVWSKEEFLSLSSEVSDTDGNSYEYSIDKDKLYVELPSIKTTDITLTLPKLYYIGYEFHSLYIEDETQGLSLECTKGYSQFITVTVPSSCTDCFFVLEYKHPFVLVVLDFTCLVAVLLLGGYYVFEISRRKD